MMGLVRLHEREDLPGIVPVCRANLSRGFCWYFSLLSKLTVLPTELPQLLELRTCQSVFTLTFLATALLALLIIPGPAAQAQTPPTCNGSICTLTLANAGSPVVDGCGEHATPGKIKLTLSSTNPNVTRQSFNISLGYITSRNDFNSTFINWEYRTTAIGRNRWRQDPLYLNRPGINFAGGVLGENIIEVRPKAGAHIWTNRNPNNPNQGPGELVIPVFTPPESSQWTHAGSAYLLFMGGKGCARVNEGGEKIGGTQ